MVLSILLPGAVALFCVAVLVELVWGFRRLTQLRDVPPALDPAPSVSIVVAARDEERNVEEAVRSLLRLDYPRYELVVVNDRSTDRTGDILRGVAAREPRLQVVDITELPKGWLGKNHALHLGAGRATGELLLFTDADIIFDPTALTRAVALMQRLRADHLAVAPELILPSIPLTVFVNYLFVWMFLALRPWKTMDPGSYAYTGIGAFNLVTAATYRAIGGHSRIAMRPDDDLMFGKVVKRSGFRQLVALGLGLIRVEWYRTLGEAIRAFRKNTFAALNYSVVLAGACVLGNFAGAWLFLLPFIAEGPGQVLYGISVAALIAASAWHARVMRMKPWLAPLYPVAALVSGVVIGSIVARTLWSRSIDWRGTSYSLDELRANRV